MRARAPCSAHPAEIRLKLDAGDAAARLSSDVTCRAADAGADVEHRRLIVQAEQLNDVVARLRA
eukprot:2958550-Prymnesium_polylepis.1